MSHPRYEPNPRYAASGGEVAVGWDAPVAALPAAPFVLAIDGPMVLDWPGIVAALSTSLARTRVVPECVDVRDWYQPWPEVLHRTSSPALADDPHFERLAETEIAALLQAVPAIDAGPGGIVVAYGPGAALGPHDVLWYVDLPKRYAEAEVAAGRGRNLGQREADGPATSRRLFYVDWPVLDRHREAISPRIDRWIDAQDLDRPTSVDGVTLRETLQALAERPFRTRPTFNTTPWGGHWAQRTLGFNPAAPNTALGYELIAPESGVLVGEDAVVELPFQLLVAAHPQEVLGADVHGTFGTSFPVRFDYLDTVDGGNLSVHCHPRPAYMREVFGWPYPQHETYYLMVGAAENQVFLGLRGDVDVAEFHRLAHEAESGGVELDIERFVQTFPATPHQLFCVPAGTPHGSGVGNVVLEISATPYLYSLRFYDWLRRSADGTQRPVHVAHAFENLDTHRTGARVAADLVQSPQLLRAGDGWREEVLGALPELFFEVRRVVIDTAETAPDDTAGRFHVLNVVEGAGVRVEPAAGPAHALAYAETMVIPAAVGAYRLRRIGAEPVRLVKAVVP